MNADEALERAAIALETRAGNSVYQKAWRAAAKLLRSMKASAEVNRQDAEVNPHADENHIDGNVTGSR